MLAEMFSTIGTGLRLLTNMTSKMPGQRVTVQEALATVNAAVMSLTRHSFPVASEFTVWE